MKIKTCRPHHLPLKSFDWLSCIPWLGRAHASVARFNEILTRVKKPSAIFSLLTWQETLASSSFRKDTVTLDEVLLARAQGVHGLLDIEKALNYLDALKEASKKIHTHPFSFALLCRIHARVQKHVKEVPQEVGHFRMRQNWIGPEGAGIEEAYFFPPAVNLLSRSMRNLKQYLHYQEKDPLVQIALFLGQHLIIHPFMDGNGRVGRLLLPLLLYKKNLTSYPLFYVSAYFKKHRLEYLEHLLFITVKGRWEGWVQFFLKAVIHQAERNHQLASHIYSLYENFLAALPSSRESQTLIETLFASIIVDCNQLSKTKTTLKGLKTLEEKGLVIRYKKPSIIAVKSLLTLNHDMYI